MTRYTIVDQEAVFDHLGGISDAFAECDDRDELEEEVDEALSRVLNEFHGIGQPIDLTHDEKSNYLKLSMDIGELVEE